MPLNKDRETIIDFLFDALSQEKKSEVADKIINNKDFRNLYKEEKNKFITYSYVDNTLQPHEQIEFEQYLKKDKQLSKEVDILKDIDLFLECNALKDTLNNISLHKESIAPAPVKVRTLKKWVAAASIAFLLISGGGINQYFLNRESLENRLYNTYYEPFDKSGQYVLNSSALNLAQQKYMNGEYINALLLFQRLPVSLTIEAERHFYIGLSLMELEQYEKAIESFEQVTKCQEGMEYLPQIQWYKGLNYLKTGDREKAIEVFTTIVSYNDCNSKKAKKILRKLEK